MDDAEWEWRAHGTQIRRIKVDAEKNSQEVLSTTNQIEDVILKNNMIFSGKWEVTHDWIDCRSEEHLLLKNRVVDLESLLGLQQTTLQHCQDTIAGLEETVAQLVASVKKLEKTVCQCHNQLLSLGPHYMPGEEEEMVEESEEDEEEEEDEESSLEYTTETPSGDSYMTPPSTGGRSPPSPFPSCLPTPEDSNPENNMVLRTKELEAHIEVFLEEAEEDIEMSNLPPLKNVSLLPVPAPVVPRFIPFAISTGQCCVPPRNLLREVWHPYLDSVGQCHCEPGSWCNNLPCAGRVRRVPRKIRGHGLLNGGSWSGRSCCGTDEEPFDQPRSLCGGRTPTHAPCPGSPEL